jgi:TonB family protein
MAVLLACAWTNSTHLDLDLSSFPRQEAANHAMLFVVFAFKRTFHVEAEVACPAPLESWRLTIVNSANAWLKILRVFVTSLCVVWFLTVNAVPLDADDQRPSISDADVTAPHLVYCPDPEYPPAARAAGHQGTSILSLTVGTDGTPRDITVLRNLDVELDNAAVAAVSTWRYEPALKDDQPVEVDIHARVRFRLYDGDKRKIAELWDRSDSNDPKADWALSKAYFEGNGVPQDDQLGLQFLKMAADWNLPAAQFQMGEYYYKNQSPPNLVAAYMWYALSKRAGGKQGEQMLKELAPEMSPEQLSQAEEQIAYWPENPPKEPSQ